MELSEIRDEPIDVEEAMRAIMEKSCQRNGDVRDLALWYTSASWDSFKGDLDCIKTGWNVQVDYSISTHRPIAGWALVKGRTMVHDEVRRYIDPMIKRQTEFNSSLARLFIEAVRRMDLIESRIYQPVDISAGPTLDPEICKEIEDTVKSAVAAVNADVDGKAWLAGVLEDRIRHHDEQLSSKERPSFSRDHSDQVRSVIDRYLAGSQSVLDIGCGRGTFLEVMAELGIDAHGVDNDPSMVDFCTFGGLSAEKSDAIAYLENTADAGLDGILLDQLIDRLDPGYLMRLLCLCSKKLKVGGYLIIDIISPVSSSSFAGFYLDTADRRSVNLEALKFLLSAEGFLEVEVRSTSSVPDEARLRKMDQDDSLAERERRMIEIYNHNIEMLNNVLFGARDYLLVAKTGRGSS